MGGNNGWWSSSGGSSSSSSSGSKSSGWWGGSSSGNAPSSKGSGGGALGFLKGAAHAVASKAALAGHDIASIPGGIKQLGQSEYDVLKYTAEHPIASTMSGLRDYKHPVAAVEGKLHNDRASRVAGGFVQGSVESLKHPLRDPFQTLATVGPLLHGVGRVAEVAARVDNSVPRTLRQGEGKVGLPPRAGNAAVRVAQRGYDATLQRAIDKNSEGKIASHAAKRLGGQIKEVERPRQQMRAVPADMLDAAGKELRGRIGNHSFPNKAMAEHALRLTSENSTAKEAAHFHALQAAKGVAPKANLKMAKLYRQMDEQGLLKLDEHGNVQVDAERFPRLAAADARLAHAQATGERIIGEHKLMSPEGAKARVDLPGQIRRAGIDESPLSTNAFFGKADSVLRSRLAKLDGDYKRLVEQAMGGKPGDYKNVTALQNGRLRKYNLPTVRDQLFSDAEKHVLDTVRANPDHPAVQAFVQKLNEADAIRSELERRGDVSIGLTHEPTYPPLVRERSIYGPEGRGYVSHAQLEKRAPKTPVARAQGAVVGEAKSPIGAKSFTGEAMAQGKVPRDTTRSASRRLRDLVRYVNTSEIRKRWLETGSDTRRTSRDVLARVPGATPAKLTPEQEAFLGRGRLTAPETEAAQATLREFVNDLVPGANDEKVRAWEEAHGIGEKAPAGYRWVDKNVIGDLNNAFSGSRGKIGKSFDNVNSAVTAMTVYFKIGHVGTRVLTNAATNLIEGSLKHAGKSMSLWRELTPEERLNALAASGQHGFSALPHEGEGFVGRAATKGANWWAKHADAPFRFNAIAYEAAKAGFKTPAEFRKFLKLAADPSGLSDEDRIRIENVLKETNRSNISYDRLNDKERRFIARGLWFYPWVKGSTAFTVRTALEHPFKTAVLGNAGAQGRKEQERVLGALPSYENGLIPLGHNRVTNLSTFSPFATAGDLLQLPEYSAAADNLNPAAAGLLHFATRTNQYGAHSNSPLLDALSSVVSPTPEFQIAEAFRRGGSDQSKKMFPTSTRDAILRMLVGPAVPRRFNPAAGNAAAAREKSGR